MQSRILRALFIALLPPMVFGACALNLYARSGEDQQKQTVSQPAAQPAAEARTGSQVFTENCSRCHIPPMSIAPRATGTIIMHMRTRAKLSREDEKLLLKFMAP